jgi:hypothetical protein
LDELDVVTSQKYMPTDGVFDPRSTANLLIVVAHILRARLKTLV